MFDDVPELGVHAAWIAHHQTNYFLIRCLRRPRGGLGLTLAVATLSSFSNCRTFIRNVAFSGSLRAMSLIVFAIRWAGPVVSSPAKNFILNCFAVTPDFSASRRMFYSSCRRRCG